MLNRSTAAGFTLVEILTGLTIVAVLIGLGVPSLSSYLQSAKLSSAANSYYSGLQQARTEAIRRNFRTEFVLTDSVINTPDDATRDALAAGVARAPNGRSWVVRASQPAPADFAFVEAKAGVEGAFAGTATSIAVVGGGPLYDGSIAFNGFGLPIFAPGAVPGPYTIDVSNPGGGDCAPAGPMRCQRVQVTAAGRVMLCDPQAVAGDSRFCTP